MESLVLLVLLAGGGMFVYRQWKAMQAEALPCRVENYRLRPQDPDLRLALLERRFDFVDQNAVHVGSRR